MTVGFVDFFDESSFPSLIRGLQTINTSAGLFVLSGNSCWRQTLVSKPLDGFSGLLCKINKIFLITQIPFYLLAVFEESLFLCVGVSIIPVSIGYYPISEAISYIEEHIHHVLESKRRWNNRIQLIILIRMGSSTSYLSFDSPEDVIESKTSGQVLLFRN